MAPMGDPVPVPSVHAATTPATPILIPALTIPIPDGAVLPRPEVDPVPLGYALTWWGLAGALVGVYLAFHARQGRFVIK